MEGANRGMTRSIHREFSPGDFSWKNKDLRELGMKNGCPGELGLPRFFFARKRFSLTSFQKQKVLIEKAKRFDRIVYGEFSYLYFGI